MYEIYEVIDLIKEKFNATGEEKVIYTEDGIMHTVKIGKMTYKAIKNDKGWNIMKMR